MEYENDTRHRQDDELTALVSIYGDDVVLVPKENRWKVSFFGVVK